MILDSKIPSCLYGWEVQRSGDTGRRCKRFHKYFLGNKIEHLNLLSLEQEFRFSCQNI